MAKRQRRRRDERRKDHARRQGLKTRHSVITGVAVGATSMLGFAHGASAYTFQVNNGGDAGNAICEDVTPGDCTLRDAVYAANYYVGTDSITFASNISGVTLGGNQLYVVDGTNITGNGAGATTISGNNTSRIFVTNPNYGLQTVNISNLTLTQGNSGNYDGGAIYNFDGNLNLLNTVLTGNHANDGGAIYDYGGYYAGQDNDIVASTISNNTATDDGGGFYARGSAGQVIASTISGNSAGSSNGQVGGGIYMYLGSYLDDDTIAGNSAFAGGGVYAYYLNTSGVYNTIVSNNSAAPTFGRDFQGDAYAQASLFQTTTFATFTQIPGGPPNIFGQDPQLGPLQNNGGPTPTRLLAPTSPAIDKGFSYTSNDQRGVGRPIDITTVANAPNGDGSDVGAVELTAAEATIPPGPQPPVTQPKKKKCKKKKKKHSSAQVSKKKKCKKKKKHSAAVEFRQAGSKDWPGDAFKAPRPHRGSD